MFRPTRYLEWARRFYGRVPFDLASSGTRPFPLGELGLPSPAEMDDPSAWDALVAAIARYHDVPRDEAIAALGTTHALWLAYASLTSPGDEVLVETPGYEPVSRIAEGLGLRLRTFERSFDRRFALDPDVVARAMSPETRVVVVTNLHNPGGVRAGDDELGAVASMAAAKGAVLLVDEVYSPFDDLVDASGVFHHSARKLAPNVVTVGSLTKAFGLGAHRIGWVLGPPEVIARARHAITASAGMLPLSHASLACRAFARISVLADASRRALDGKRTRVDRWIQEQGLTWSQPREGLFGFVRLRGVTDLTSTIERAANERGVLVAPGAFFGDPAGFRISWSAPDPALDEGLSRLGALLASLPLRP
jgi:aspartate/methionine/tyrosine aminotransferase